MTPAATFLCLVLAVVDGDTFDCQDTGRVRLWGADAPERGQPQGREATARLRALIAGKALDCTIKGDPHRERDVASCKLDGRDVASVLVSEGLAWDAYPYSRGHYAIEQTSAACLGLGIWSTGVLDPSDWRKCRRRPKS